MSASEQPDAPPRRERLRAAIKWSALTLAMTVAGILLGIGLAVFNSRPLDKDTYASAISLGLVFGNLPVAFPIGSRLGAALAYKDKKIARALPALGFASAALLANACIVAGLMTVQLAWQPALPFLTLLVAIGAEASSFPGRIPKVLPRRKRKQ